MKVCQVGSSLHDFGGIERYLVYLCQALRDRGHEVTCIVPKGSPLDERITTPKEPISLHRQFQLSLFPKFLNFFRTHRFDVVNTHFSPDYVIPALAAKVAGQPCRILTRHVLVPWKPSKTKRYSSLFTHFVGVSNAVGNMLVNGAIPKERVMVAEPGCPPLTPSKPKNPGAFRAGFFGRIVED
ncbi:MAG TPA: glycosyltransferase family 4 protein, partial [Fimbriimonadaceae bacterium]|nr:glycosyltransferase family 4 protein [Fimbriimonadaceae bacterium]